MQPLALRDSVSGRLVVVNSSVMDLVTRYRQAGKKDSESGGILIGIRRGEHFEVTAATMPQISDKRSRFRFERVEKGHSDLLKRHWLESKGEENYLGEWHTHPEDYPSPSNLDLSEWQRAATHHKCSLIMIIVGRKANYFSLVTRRDISPLHVVL
ncbi:hypothetical protein DT381_02275 [Pseudomonas aeruginosa]|nr:MULTISPECIES: Mov34/MPN/PAD-1 family protein [Pseudomonadaceae]MDV5860594.1 Mov34/MPN/PAD-1 family protein [Pseudomonas mendocina]RCI61442.1 hypothetical protein DT381_02275 [Pseudomonas aeruginosa]TXR36354.1 hypothetical protein FVE88_19205 [Pseudomonas mendocina]